MKTDKIIEILKGFAVSPLIGDDIDYRNLIAEEINQLLSTPPTEDKVPDAEDIRNEAKFHANSDKTGNFGLVHKYFRIGAEWALEQFAQSQPKGRMKDLGLEEQERQLREKE